MSGSDMTKFYENSPIDWKGIMEGIGLQQSLAWFRDKDGVSDNRYRVVHFMPPWVPWRRLSFSFQAGAWKTGHSRFPYKQTIT
jgi:hypothetical protein